MVGKVARRYIRPEEEFYVLFSDNNEYLGQYIIDYYILTSQKKVECEDMLVI